jgi:hypothetical protein
MRKAFIIFFAAFWSTILLAQDQGGGSDVKVDINKGGDGGGNWYASPWVWVIVAAVFILLLVVLTRGGGKRVD